MGLEVEQEETNLPAPPVIKNKTDFVAAYDELVLQAPDTCTRCKCRELLKGPSLQFLRTVQPGGKFEHVTGEVLEQTVTGTEKWEPGKALEVCRNLEDLMLRLWDQPWRKEFHVIKLYSGYFRTMVMQHLSDADRLLEMGGYRMDLSGHQMVLSGAPSQSAILLAASEMYLLGLECQVYREVLCLVQPQGYTITQVAECRMSIAGDNEQAAKWIREERQPDRRGGRRGKGGMMGRLATVPDDPIYAEIESPVPSPDSSRRSLKSSATSVNTDISPSRAGLSSSSGMVNVVDLSEDERGSVKSPQSEPLYSVVKKPPKKDSNNHKKSAPVEPTKQFTSDSASAPPVSSPSPVNQKHSPRKPKNQDSGYISKPNSQELGIVEDGSYVRVDYLTDDQQGQGHNSKVQSQNKGLGQVQGQGKGQGQYGFDIQGLQALRGSPKAHDMFQPATADEHQRQSLHSVLLEMDSPEEVVRDTSPRVAPSPTSREWAFVHEDLEKRFGQQHILGERGDILGQEGVEGVERSATLGNKTGADRHSNITFSTFRPPHQSPQQTRPAAINTLLSDMQRATSPYENVGLVVGSNNWEIKRPPARPTQPSVLGAIPVKLPTAPALDTRPFPLEHTSHLQNKKSFAENVEKRKSFYDNLPREETDSQDVDIDVAEDKVLRLLEHTKERIEKNLLDPATLQALQETQGLGVNCGSTGAGLPNSYCAAGGPTATAPNATAPTLASQCYYSVPDIHRDNGVATEDPKPRQSVTAPIVGKAEDAVNHQPPHMHMMGNHWQCEACTSFNLQGTEICDICGKSRLKGAEQQPLVSGGPQCPKCTLINEIGASMCDACDYRFERGVPTYI